MKLTIDSCFRLIDESGYEYHISIKYLIMSANIFCLICFLFLNYSSVKSEKEKDCISCRKNVLKLFVLYRSKAVNFKKDICTKMSDSEDCKIKMTKWWPYLSQIIYSDIAPKYICKVMDPNCKFK